MAWLDIDVIVSSSYSSPNGRDLTQRVITSRKRFALIVACQQGASTLGTIPRDADSKRRPKMGAISNVLPSRQ